MNTSLDSTFPQRQVLLSSLDDKEQACLRLYEDGFVGLANAFSTASLVGTYSASHVPLG
ncbi:MAG: hypothetical protein JO097_15205 [Acidobacteriaceae bacterium]|nr:hypothetical protein [Acidobacteriaceae bacterium]MBV9294137.1 hypothetical protein [Acidobacteriaceae bacterium]